MLEKMVISSGEPRNTTRIEHARLNAVAQSGAPWRLVGWKNLGSSPSWAAW